jgi:hypothetical protein
MVFTRQFGKGKTSVFELATHRMNPGTWHLGLLCQRDKGFQLSLVFGLGWWLLGVQVTRAVED